jgi:hypothetical protein
VRFTEKPFTQNGVTYKPGSLIISKADNQQKDFVKQLETISQEYARTLKPLKSGFSDSTPDLGSPDVKLIHRPKIAVLGGDGISSLNFGELWHFFEKQLDYPVTNINSKEFNRLNLNDFNTIILPSGYYNNVFNEAQLNNLKEWISKGGKLIALEGAVRSFAGKEGFGINYKETENTNTNNTLLPYAERERAYADQMITGAIFKTDVDATHPLAFGYIDVYHTLKLDNTNYTLLNSGYNVAHINNSTKPIAGFAGNEAVKNLSQTLIFGEQPMGRGSLIYLTDNPVFRGFWENGKLFLANAIFFVNNNAFTL